MSLRFDRAQFNSSNVEELSDGRLRVRATFSRVGPLNYMRSDGTLQVEHVTAEELFKPDSLETAGLAAVTLNHPPDGMVTPKTWKKYNVGASGSEVLANRQDGLVSVVFVVGDEEAIAAVKTGKATEVSAGYSTLVEHRADGKFYQTNRVYNHLALVERGRAGPSVRLHLDAADDWAVMADDETPHNDAKGGCDCMGKYKGFEMDEGGIEAFKKMETDISSMKEEMKGLKSKKDSLESDRIALLEGQIAAYQSKVDSLESDLGTRLDAAAVSAEATARLDAYTECQQFLPEAVKFDAEMSPMDWRKAAIAHVNPSLELEGRSDDFVTGMFSTLVALGSTVQAKTDAAKATDFRRVLDAAATAGHSGASLTRGDEDDARQDAEDVAAINGLFAPKGGAK
jgi:hypothetical protein